MCSAPNAASRFELDRTTLQQQRTFVRVVFFVDEPNPQPLSQLLAPCVRYTQSGEINFENNDKLGALAKLKSTFPHAKTYELDGLSIDAGEWWANIRMSNTEPLLRLNLEATDRATVDRMVAELEPILGHRVAH